MVLNLAKSRTFLGNLQDFQWAVQNASTSVETELLLPRYAAPPVVNITSAQEEMLQSKYFTTGPRLVQTIWDNTIAGVHLSAIYTGGASPLLNALGNAVQNALPDDLAVWDAGQEAGATIYQVYAPIFREWGERAQQIMVSFTSNVNKSSYLGDISYRNALNTLQTQGAGISISNLGGNLIVTVNGAFGNGSLTTQEKTQLVEAAINEYISSHKLTSQVTQVSIVGFHNQQEEEVLGSLTNMKLGNGSPQVSVSFIDPNSAKVYGNGASPFPNVTLDNTVAVPASSSTPILSAPSYYIIGSGTGAPPASPVGFEPVKIPFSGNGTVSITPDPRQSEINDLPETSPGGN